MARNPEPEPTGTAIDLIGVAHTYQACTPWARSALHDLDLEIPPGDRVLIVGTNGSGKSTLAWLLAGLLAPSTGQALIGTRPLTDHTDKIGFVVQHTRLQLLRPTIGSELDSFTTNRGHQTAALDALGFSATDRARRIDDLSIGQQRRVGLAVQLARRTPVLVLDEPMAGLDRPSRSALAAATRALGSDVTVITVTHDLDDSKPLGHRLLHLVDGRLLRDEATRSGSTR